ncbi:MAG: hypothetical protein AB8B46_05775 [Candidatus Midichloriaceae bacterium]
MGQTSFSIIKPALALAIGEPEAIILERIAAYSKGNAHKLEGEEGKWIYNSISSWHSQHFPHWSESKIYRTIKSLEEKKLIRSKKANFKKSQHTKWYSLNEKEYNELNVRVYGNIPTLEDQASHFDEQIITTRQNDENIKVTESSLTKSSSSKWKEEEIKIVMKKQRSEELEKISGIKEQDNKINLLFKKNKLNENNYSAQIEELEKIKGINELVEEIIENRVNERLEERLKEIIRNSTDENGNKAIIQKGLNFRNKNPVKTNVLEVGAQEIITESSREMDRVKEQDAFYNEIAIQMVELWNKVFEHSVKPIKAYNNKNNQPRLLQLYKTVFNSDLNNWREYACKANSSQFLMGEKKTNNGFKAVFSWLIKTETIEKILNGEYGVGDRELDMNNISKNNELKKQEKINQLENKVSDYIRTNIDELIEQQEFAEYINEEKYNIDNDYYKLGRILRHIPKFSFFNLSEYEGMRKTLFESYIMKKYTNRTKLESRQLLAKKIDEINNDKIKVTGIELPSVLLHRNMQQYDDHNIINQNYN